MKQFFWFAFLCVTLGCADGTKPVVPVNPDVGPAAQENKRSGKPVSRTEAERRDVVSVTPAAAAEIRKLLKKKGDPYLRVSTKPSEYSQFQEEITSDNHVDVEKDVLGLSREISIVIDLASIPFLDDATIDWYRNFDVSGFVFNNPNSPKDPAESTTE